MNRVVPLGLTVLSILSAVSTVPGALVYVDGVDNNNHPSAPAGINLYNLTNSPLTTSTSDGTLWRYRDSGPAAVSYGQSAYQGRSSEGDPPFYAKATGLTPGAEYGGLRLYFIPSPSASDRTIQYSLDGTTWSASLNASSSGVVMLDPSTTDALGTPASPPPTSGSTRSYYPIAEAATANGIGEIRLYVRSPTGAERTVYDGLAYDNDPLSSPTKASAPQPPNGVFLVGSNAVTTLSWNNPVPTGTLTCNVYFGDQNDYNPGNTNHFGLPLLQGGLTTNSIAAPALTEGNSYYWVVDCVDTATGLAPGDLWTLTIQTSTVGPNASNPQPTNGSILYGFDAISSLSWSNPPPTGTLTCNVYFGDQNDYDAGNTNHFGLPPLQSGLTGETLAVPALTEGDTYYWIVDCNDTLSGLSPGDLWSFAVLTPPPTKATVPQPVNGASLFGSNSVSSLSWSNPVPVGTLTCNVYFGDQNDYNPGNTNHYGLSLLQSGVTGSSVAAPALTEENTYYWIVDCDDTVLGLTAGDLWSFQILTPIPPKATAPQPADSASLVSTNAISSLLWNNPDATGTLTCIVYFGDQNDYDAGNTNHYGLPLIQSGLAGSSLPVPVLSEGDSYYWIVDCVDTVAGTFPGDLWTFNVVSAPPPKGVIITEFMAANDSTLTNAFGGTGDWVELYNNTASLVDLAGWHLTDDANNLIKWTFPSVLISPGGYLVVWASNENTITNGEIHTSFRLSAGGEYLALVRPDGVTIEHEYAPEFPEQDADISYGVDLLMNGADVVLSQSQTGTRLLVPTGDIGTGWHNRIYDDSSWQAGPTAVGYETSGTVYEEEINTDVEADMYNQMTSIYLRIPFEVEDPALFASLRIRMRFEDGFVAYINGVEVASSNAPASPAWNASATASRDQNQALAQAEFAVAQTPSTLLVSGTNMLVVHGLNQTAVAASFFMQPSLEATLENGFTLLQKRYYSVPTPGAANTDAFLGFVADTKFSVDRGFYSSPFSVAITCDTPGAAIRYTLDGTPPSDVDGTLYSGPIPVNTTTTLRAVAYQTGWKASDVDTHTYIFVEDVLTQPSNPSGWPSSWYGALVNESVSGDYEMDPQVIGSPNNLANDVRAALTNIPTISLVTDLDHLFDPNTGIYVNTRNNGVYEGVAWERPVSAEMIYPDGTKGWQANCGLRLQGGGSRGVNSTPKHSLRLLFKSIYGPGRLNHKMFPETDVDSFNTIHLRAAYNNNWTKTDSAQRARAQYNRDLFARDLQHGMGQETDYGTICHLYINGIYWGIYNPGERPEGAWATDHFGGIEEDWDATNNGETPFVDGDTTDWDAMWSLASSSSVLANQATYDNFRQYCDVEALVDYIMIAFYTGNTDWDNRNWYAAGNVGAGEGWRFICWDTEGGLTDLNGNVTGNNSQYATDGPARLFDYATANAEFRLLVADRLHKHFYNGGILTPTGATNTWRKRSDVIDTVIAAESARWGDYRGTLYTPGNQYQAQQNYLFNTYFPQRSGIVINQYIAEGLYPGLAAPEFGQHGGTFSNSMSVTISGPSTIYYTLDGTDPREYGTGNVLGTQYTSSITITNSTRVMARCKSGSTWSALLEADFLDVSPSPLRVSEVMYAPRLPAGAETAVASNAQAFAFIELQNTGPDTVGLVGVQLSDGIKFDFSNSPTLSLGAGQYIVVVEDPAAFAVRYPSVTADKIAGEYRGDLTFSGDSIKLLVEGVGQVVSFDYSDGRGWPLAADGAGHSLIPLVMAEQSSGQLDYGGNWKASVEVDGSPGAAEPNPLAQLALNEIIAHTDFSHPSYPGYDSNDKIEIMNYGVSSESLNGYYLSDDPSFLKKWAIPSGINVPAGGFIVFDEITGFHAPLSSGFGLDKAGEQVVLSYASGGDPASVVDAVAFKGQENGRSLGRYPDGTGYWQACQLTPGAANVLLGQQPVISEIMYHPTSTIPLIDNTADEYVEIVNAMAQSVNLWTVESGTNIGSWRLDGEVDYVFPANTVLAAGESVMLVSFDPTNPTDRVAFLAAYGLGEPQSLFGPYSGKLSNQGGRVALEKPLGPDLAGAGISWVIVDEVIYADDNPWSLNPDGLGESLHRALVGGPGNDPASWSSDVPSPGVADVGIADLFLSIQLDSGQPTLSFDLLPDYTYTIETRTNAFSGLWTAYTTVTNPQTEQVITLPASSTPILIRMKRE